MKNTSLMVSSGNSESLGVDFIFVSEGWSKATGREGRRVRSWLRLVVASSSKCKSRNLRELLVSSGFCVDLPSLGELLAVSADMLRAWWYVEEGEWEQPQLVSLCKERVCTNSGKGFVLHWVLWRGSALDQYACVYMFFCSAMDNRREEDTMEVKEARGV